MERAEFITQGNCRPIDLVPGVEIRVLASGEQGAQGLATCSAIFQPGALLPYHTHPSGEAIIVVSGQAELLVEGRRYRLDPYDALHVPAGVAHALRNPSVSDAAILHTSFNTDSPSREFVDESFQEVDRLQTDASCPEDLRRFLDQNIYPMAAGIEVHDLFARRFGSRGICGGYGLFQPGTALPCHLHDYDESITIVTGRAVCQVAGQEYELADFDTACIPRGRPHRFLNRGDRPMAMIWVYAGDEPDRVVLDQRYCDGASPRSAWNDAGSPGQA